MTEFSRFVVSLILAAVLVIIKGGMNAGAIYGYIRNRPLDILGFVVVMIVVVEGTNYLYNKFVAPHGGLE